MSLVVANTFIPKAVDELEEAKMMNTIALYEASYESDSKVSDKLIDEYKAGQEYIADLSEDIDNMVYQLSDKKSNNDKKELLERRLTLLKKSSQNQKELAKNEEELISSKRTIRYDMYVVSGDRPISKDSPKKFKLDSAKFKNSKTLKKSPVSRTSADKKSKTPVKLVKKSATKKLKNKSKN